MWYHPTVRDARRPKVEAISLFVRDYEYSEHLLTRLSHVVGQTLGSQAYRIGGGGAWISIRVPVGQTLLSRLVLCV